MPSGKFPLVYMLEKGEIAAKKRYHASDPATLVSASYTILAGTQTRLHPHEWGEATSSRSPRTADAAFELRQPSEHPCVQSWPYLPGTAYGHVAPRYRSSKWQAGASVSRNKALPCGIPGVAILEQAITNGVVYVWL